MIFKKNQGDNKIKNTEKTVFKIKTVDDIPVVKEIRKYIGNEQIKEAIMYGYDNLQKDFIRSFNIGRSYSSNRDFIIKELNSCSIKLNEEEAYVNNNLITNSIKNSTLKPNSDQDKKEDGVSDTENNNQINRCMAIIKLSQFFVDYYEPSRYGETAINMKGEIILNKIKDIYNYMDIMALYYNNGE